MTEPQTSVSSSASLSDAVLRDEFRLLSGRVWSRLIVDAGNAPVRDATSSAMADLEMLIEMALDRIDSLRSLLDVERKQLSKMQTQGERAASAMNDGCFDEAASIMGWVIE